MVQVQALLNADGTINTRTGFTGSLDVRGYSMKPGPHGEPMFSRSPKTPMYMPGDEAWNERFGIAGTSDILFAIAIDGANLYVGGGIMKVVPGGSPQHIARWDGTQWSSLGSGVQGNVDAITIVAGTLYAGGTFDSAGGISAHNVAQWDGVNWSPLGSGTNGLVNQLAVNGSDLYIGGLFTLGGGVTVNHVAKWNGASWSALGTGTDDEVNTLVVNGSDLYVGGSFSSASGVASTSRIAKWDGANWSALGLGIGGGSAPTVSSLVFVGSDLYAGGGFSTAGVTNAKNIAKWNGSSWSALGTGTNNYVHALATDGSNLFAGGSFNTAGGFQSDRIAKWDGSSWIPLNHVITGGEINAVTFGGGVLYVDGQFDIIGGQPARSIAYWDGSNWHGMPGQGMNSPVQALAAAGNDIYAGGGFLVSGVVPVFRIGKWNDTTWTDLDGGLDSTVYTLAVSGNDLYVGGDFLTTRGGVNPSITVNHIAKWDGSSWSTLDAGIDGTVYALAVKGSDLYAGGAFLTASGIPANHVARWNGSNWSALGDGLDNTVYALAVNDSGVFAGGIFTTSVTFSLPYIARWNGATWSSPGGGMNLPVFAVTAREGDIYAGGMFTMAGVVSAGHIAKWDGSTWSSVGSGGIDGIVYALAADSGHVVAGGEFGTAGGTSASNIALWDDTSWSAMGSGLNSVDRALAIRGIDILAGGDFTSAGNKPSYHIGEWQGNKVIKKIERTYPHNPKWNMVSVAMQVDNNSKSALFPSAVSQAYSYHGVYGAEDILLRGVGYWLKFADSGGVAVSGYPITMDSIPVSPGWNMIGSISQPISTAQVMSIPPGIMTSQFFGYQGTYTISNTIEPGKAYWVKVNTPGILVLSSSVNFPQAAGKIRIVPTSELPPSVPDPETSILSADGGETPRSFSLEQNYPNPFNPSTVIRYSLPVNSQVSMKIFNMLGQEIVMLVDEGQDAGSYAVHWDASGHASGIYIYSLEANAVDGSKHHVENKKMVLIK